MATLKTIPLYQKDGQLHTHTTTISSITPLSAVSLETQTLFKNAPPTSYILSTPSTIFHAQGGGQPSDIGTMTLVPSSPATPNSEAETKPETEQAQPTFHVHSVRHSPPSILHLGSFTNLKTTPPPGAFQLSAPVLQKIDIGVRHLHSRLHTAGHALGLAVMSLTTTTTTTSPLLPPDLKEGKASHNPGTSSVEFTGLIPSTAKGAIQAAVDALIARNCVVSIHVVSETEALRLCGVVAEGVKGGEDGVRVVEIEGVGAYPCGGTHVERLGEVGRCVVKGVKRAKGVSKVSYEVVDL